MKYTVAAGFLLLAILAWLFPLKPAEKKPEGAVAATPTGVYYTSCAICHGDRGQGKRELGSPSIASLPRWYAEEQIKKFRTGLRGSHPDDATGLQMQQAINLLTEKEISEALETLDSFPAVDHELTLTGDLKRGAYLYRENCMECHRFNGRGELAFKSSHVAGLQDWYLMAQWNKFKAGSRGYHPDDEGGAKMRKAVAYLTNDDEARDVILYISTLAKKYPEDKTTKP